MSNMSIFSRIPIVLKTLALLAAIQFSTMAKADTVWFYWINAGVRYKVTVINAYSGGVSYGDLTAGKIDNKSSEVPIITEITVANNSSSVGQTYSIDLDKLFSDVYNVRFFYGKGDGFDIGPDVFKGNTDLAGVNLSSHLRNIGSGAFSDCTALTDVDIPQNVKEIGSKAFSGCTNLKPVFHLDGERPNIANDAFEGSKPRTSEDGSMLVWQNGVEYNMHPFTHKMEIEAILDDVKKSKDSLSLLGTLSLNDSIYTTKTSLGTVLAAANASEEGTAMTSLTLGEGLTSISDKAFLGCNNLKSLTLPSTFTGKLYNTMFNWDGTSTPPLDYYNLFVEGVPYKVERVADYNVKRVVGYNVEFDTDRTNLCKGKITLLRHLSFVYDSNDTPLVYGNIQDECVPANLFKGNTAISLVVVEPTRSSSDAVNWRFNSLGASCFEGCTALTTITTYPYVDTFGEGCFRGCTKLESIYIDHAAMKDKTESLTFGSECFAGCTSLSSIKLPFTASHPTMVVGEGMFSGCSNLESVDITTVVGKGTDSAYQLPQRCFEGCDKLKTLKFAYAVTDMAEGALGSKKALQTVESPMVFTANNDVKYNVKVRFDYPTQTVTLLTATDTPTSLFLQEKATLCEAEGISGTITYIADKCFANTSTENFGLPKGVRVHVPSDGIYRKSGTGLGVDCFNLDNLKSITFYTDYNDGLMYTATRSSKDNTVMLVSLQDPNMAQTCTAQEVRIPAYVVLSNITGYVNEIVARKLFNDNKTIESLTIENPYKPIPESIKDDGVRQFSIWGIKDQPIFKNCTALREIVLPDRLTYLGYAFSGDSSLETLELPACRYITGVFKNCTALKRLRFSEGTQYLLDGSFNGCTVLHSVVLPKSLMQIKAFADCTNLGALVLLAHGYRGCELNYDNLPDIKGGSSALKVFCTQESYEYFKSYKSLNVIAFQDYRYLPSAQYSYATVCLPRSFSMDNSYGMWRICKAMRMYDDYHIEFNYVNEVEAGQPCLIRRCVPYSEMNAAANIPDRNNLVVFGCDMSETPMEKPLDDDYLVGTFTTIEAPTPCYLMQSDDWFHLLKDNTTKKLKVGAYRAYMKAENTASSNIAIQEIFDDPTSINGIENNKDSHAVDAPVYNLNGQRVTAPVKGHIYIVNGKKVMF